MIWILDAAREGEFLSIPLGLGRGVLLHIENIARGYAVPIAAILFMLIQPVRRFEVRLPASWMNQVLLYSVACTLFWAIVGFHSARLAVMQFPGIVTLLGTLSIRRTKRPQTYLAAVLLFSAVAYLLGLFPY